MKFDLVYDGQFVKWPDKGLAFKATSGMDGHQVPGEQCIPDAGPVPEGIYKVFISDHGVANDDGRGICALKPSWGIQEIPRGAKAGACEPYWENWGKNRARMEPADSATKKHALLYLVEAFIFMTLQRVTVTGVLRLNLKYSLCLESIIQLRKSRL